jgi:hypothetical protein
MWICAILGSAFYAFLAFAEFKEGNSSGVVVGIIATIAFLFIAPLGWHLGDMFRRFAQPDMFFASGAIDMAKRKLFWIVGPQLIGVLIAFILLVVVVVKYAEIPKNAAKAPAEEVAAKAPAKKAPEPSSIDDPKPAMPFTPEAIQKLGNAQKEVFATVPAGIKELPPAERMKANVDFINSTYNKAGYSFDKTVIQLAEELEGNPNFLEGADKKSEGEPSTARCASLTWLHTGMMKRRLSELNLAPDPFFSPRVSKAIEYIIEKVGYPSIMEKELSN